MSERKVEKGQVYLSNEDKRRNGSTRTVTVERTVRSRRVHSVITHLYAVAVSRIDAYPGREDLIGKKRRVFIKVKSLLSAQYALCIPIDGEVIKAGDGRLAPTDAYDRPLPVPVPCGGQYSEDISTGEMMNH